MDVLVSVAIQQNPVLVGYHTTNEPDIQPDIISRVPLESLFNIAGTVIANQSSRLILENVEIVIFLKYETSLIE